MSLVIGYGEIGKAVGTMIGQHDMLDQKPGLENKSMYDELDILHICFPYTENFIEEVEKYIRNFNPQHIIIWSTVPIGTTKQIPRAVHSPVEGKHPDLADSIAIMERWLGVNDKAEGQFFTEYFHQLDLRVRVVMSSDYTEALKLLSTTEYGINIEFARYKAHVALEIGMDYQLTKEWNTEYNRLYKELGLKSYQKFVLDAPDGPKGGHCVTPNALILNEQYPSIITEIVGEL